MCSRRVSTYCAKYHGRRFAYVSTLFGDGCNSVGPTNYVRLYQNSFTENAAFSINLLFLCVFLSFFALRYGIVISFSTEEFNIPFVYSDFLLNLVYKYVNEQKVRGLSQLMKVCSMPK